MKRIGVFGWGVVAPGAENVDVFARRLSEAGTWLTPFDGYGPSNFLVGEPDFDFATYKEWVGERFPPSRFPGLDRKMGTPTKYAIGAFIQALGQNEGLEAAMKEAGIRSQVMIGGGLTDIPTYQREGLRVHRAQRLWNRFWAAADNNEVYAAYRDGETKGHEDAPRDPEGVPFEERDDAEETFWAYWAAKSPKLAQYLTELRAIEGMAITGDVEAEKGKLIKKKRGAMIALKKSYGAPPAPWDEVSADALWNIANTPASQVSMLGELHGMCFAPFAACSSFGFALKLAMDAIRRDEADFAVVGSTEPAPHPISVGTFYNARVLSHDGEVSKPLTGMKGTHVSGGACVWIVGDMDKGLAKGFKPLGMEPLSVGISSDADHIITPSVPGPTAAIETALEQAGVDASEVADWDLHATGTPGDFLEVRTACAKLPDSTRMTARKGTFGHGFGAGGGWELTAQYLSYERGEVYPTTLEQGELNSEIEKDHKRFVHTSAEPADGKYAGKLSMGVGGINACVVSRRL